MHVLFSTENTGKLHATICKNSSFGEKFASVMCNSGHSVCISHVLHHNLESTSLDNQADTFRSKREIKI